jgi:hypothetical protein
MSSPMLSAKTMEEKGDVSEKMKALLEHQQQLKTWLHDVKHKIYETETIYLEETQLGNLVKGWEIDGRPPLSRVRGQCEEKERLFTYSSYETLMEHKQTQEVGLIEKKLTTASTIKSAQVPKARKLKKRKSESIDDWNNMADY